MNPNLASIIANTIICPCGKTVSGVGLVNHMHTKERWYRLHQKKCDMCRPVQFYELMCTSLCDNLIKKSERESIILNVNRRKYDGNLDESELLSKFLR